MRGLGRSGAEVTTAHPWLALPDEQIARYNHYDVWATARLAKVLTRRLQESHQWDFYCREVEPCIEPILAMGQRGIPIDLAERTRLRRTFRAEVRRCDQELAKAAGHPYVDPYEAPPRGPWFNPNSDTQVRRWLFGGDRTTQPAGAPVEVTKGVVVACLGLKPAGRTESKLWSVDLTNLVRVVRDLRKGDEPHRPILYALTHRSRYRKLDEYLDFEVEGDGRVRPQWKLHGTKSLRLAVSDPPLHSWADEMRTMVRAPEGSCFVKCDFSAVEARMAAYLSGDQLDIAVYERDPADRPYKHHPAWDIHSSMVLQCFPELDEPTWARMEGSQRELYRNLCKTLRYGTLLYGGEPETAKTKVFCPCPRCEGRTPPSIQLTPERKRQIVDAWMAQHTAFVRWRASLVAPFQGPHATYCLRLPLSGWRVWFFQPWSPDLEREVYNRPIQHAANILKLRALRRLHERGVPLIIDWHDALVAEVPEGEAEATLATMRECMEAPVPELGGVRFPVDAAVGRSLGELH